jgi:photosynthetic reaction center cytochrome c subunit
VQVAPTAAEAAVMNTAPRPIAPAPADPRPASQAYKNLQVLGDLNAGQLMQTMQAMTAWVAPKQGCGFCHAGGDYASQANPHLAVARAMLRMTRHINTAGRGHVGAAGVTCFSCHQGQPVPASVWFAARPRPPQPMIDRQDDWREDAKTVRNFFPFEGYEEYLLQDTPGIGQSYTALPTGQTASQIVIKRLYEAMMQMSDGMGVNCGYCHNSRAFWDWSQSTPARWQGYAGIELTRDLNRNYLLPLGQTLPQTRFRLTKAGEPGIPPHEEGATAGNGLVDCATCHHGQPKPQPIGGQASAYPALMGAGAPSAASPGKGG